MHKNCHRRSDKCGKNVTQSDPRLTKQSTNCPFPYSINQLTWTKWMQWNKSAKQTQWYMSTHINLNTHTNFLFSPLWIDYLCCIQRLEVLAISSQPLNTKPWRNPNIISVTKVQSCCGEQNRSPQGHVFMKALPRFLGPAICDAELQGGVWKNCHYRVSVK